MPWRVAFSEPHINVLENERILLEDRGFERAGGEPLRAAFDDVRAAAESLDFRTEPTPEEVESSRVTGAAWDRVLGQFGFRRLPSPMTAAEMTAALDQVAEARQIHGPAAARSLWFHLGLPRTAAMMAGPRQGDLFTYTAANAASRP